MRFLVTLCFLFCVGCLHAQTAATADILYQQQQYQRANQIYLQNLSTLDGEQLSKLAITYFHANPDRPDYVTIKRYLEAGAAKGSATGMKNLAIMYAQGMGEAADTLKAFQWMEKAAATGDGEALYNLGNCYYIGMWVKKDRAKGLELMKKAAAKNFDCARLYLAEVADAAGNYQEAVQLYKDSKDAAAQFFLGNYYRTGKGVTRNIEASIEAYYNAIRILLNDGNVSCVGSEELLQDLVDSLIQNRSVSLPNLKLTIDGLMSGLQNGFSNIRGEKMNAPIMLWAIKYSHVLPSLETGREKITYYRVSGKGPFLTNYIRNYVSEFVPADQNAWLFSGIMGQGLEKDMGIAYFEEWAGAIRKAYPGYKHKNETEKTVSPYEAKRTQKSDGQFNGKDVFIELRLRPLKNLHLIEIVVRNGGGGRND